MESTFRCLEKVHICLSVYLSIFLSIIYVSIYLYLYLSIYLSIYLSTFLSILRVSFFSYLREQKKTLMKKQKTR